MLYLLKSIHLFGISCVMYSQFPLKWEKGNLEKGHLAVALQLSPVYTPPPLSKNFYWGKEGGSVHRLWSSSEPLIKTPKGCRSFVFRLGSSVNYVNCFCNQSLVVFPELQVYPNQGMVHAFLHYFYDSLCTTPFHRKKNWRGWEGIAVCRLYELHLP